MIDVLREMGMASRALDAMANAEFKKLDLARGQFVYLVRIYEHPGIIARDLAKLILMDKTTIARAVAKLEKNGLIVRRSDPANHRIKRMYVTKKGAELYPFIIRENEHSKAFHLKKRSRLTTTCSGCAKISKKTGILLKQVVKEIINDI